MVFKNKKGQFETLNFILLAFIFISGATAAAVFILMFVNTFNDQFQTTTATTEAKTLSANYTDSTNSTLDNILFLAFILFVIGSWIISAALPSNRIFFVIYIVLALMLFFAIPLFANLVSGVMSSSELISFGDYLPKMKFINDYLLIFFIVFVASNGFILFNKQ